jgi:hypothetical protein
MCYVSLISGRNSDNFVVIFGYIYFAPEKKAGIKHSGSSK